MKNIISTFKENFRFLQLCTMFLFALSIIPTMSVHAETISGNDSTSNLPVIYPDSPFSSDNNFDVRLTKEEYDSLLPVFDSSYDNFFKSELELRGQQKPDSFITNIVFWTRVSDSETTYFQSNDSGESVERSKINLRQYYSAYCNVNSYSADYNKVGYCFIYDEEYNTAHPDTNARYYRLYRLNPDSNSLTDVRSKIIDMTLNYQYDSGTSSVNNVKSTYYYTSRYTPSDVIVNFNNDYALEVGSNSTKKTVINSMFCNVPVFDAMNDANSYFSSGDMSNVLNPDGYFGSVYDPDDPTKPDKPGDYTIGYLKDLTLSDKRTITHPENDLPIDTINTFTWADTYDYDDTYMVEVYAQLRGQWRAPLIFGGAGAYGDNYEKYIKEYYSDNKLVKTCKYNDLKVKIYYKDEVYPLLEPAINELKSLSGMHVFTVDYYFRIYHYNEKLGINEYGPYTGYVDVTKNLFKDEIKNEIQYGDMDENGFFIKDENLIPEPAEKPNYGFGPTEEEADNNASKPKPPIDSLFPEWDGNFSLEYIRQILEWLFNSIYNLFLLIGQVPEFILAVFPFLPNSFSFFIGIGLITVIILRILGR